MHVATIEYTNCMHTLKQKVRTKDKREVRGIVDNNHIGLKNRQITRIHLGKKVYNARSLLKLAILSFLTALYFLTTNLCLTGHPAHIIVVSDLSRFQHG